MNKKEHHNTVLSLIVPIHILTKSIIENIKKFQFVEKNLPIEFIFIFNGIKKKKLKSFPENKNFYYISKNTGPGPARNLGIKKSKGNWLLFLDSDDDIVIKNFPQLINYIKRKNCNFLGLNFFTNYKKYKKNHKKFKFNYKKTSLIKKIQLFLNQKLEYAIIFYVFKKSFLMKYKIFFADGYFEDIFFHFKIFFFNRNCQIFYFKKKFYCKNYNPNSITSSITQKHVKDFINAWLSVIKFSRKKFPREKMENLYQFTLRGVLGYLIKKVESSRLISKEKQRLKISIIYNLKKYINKNFIVRTKYDKYAREYLN